MEELLPERETVVDAPEAEQVRRPRDASVVETPDSDEGYQQAIQELVEMRRKSEKERAAAAKAAPEAIHQVVVTPAPEPIIVPEVQAEAPVISSEPPAAVIETVRDDVDELFDHAEEQKPTVDEFSMAELARYEATPLGEGRQCKVTRLKDPLTGKSLLLFQARPGAENKLAVHADILRQLEGSEHFLSVRHFSEGSDIEPAYMVCEDPGTVPLTEKIEELNLEQRMSLVPQLAEAFRSLHVRAGKLHTDPFPKQLYVIEEGSDVRLIVSDLGDAQEVGTEMDTCQNSLLEEHDQSTALFNTSFASADRRRGLPYDQQAEIEVIARLATWILTGQEPIDGVRPTLEEFREGLETVSPELDDMIVRITVAAEKNREKRYADMKAFSKALASSKQLQMSQGKSLGLRIDFDRLDSPETVAHLRKSLGEIDPRDLDPRVATAFEKLKESETRMIEDLRELRAKRDEEFRKNGFKDTILTTGEHVIINALRFPSERVQAAAIVTAFDNFSQNYQLTRVSEAVKTEARRVLYIDSFAGDDIIRQYLSASYKLLDSGIYTAEKNTASRNPQNEIQLGMKLLASSWIRYEDLENILCCFLTHIDILPPGTLSQWSDVFIGSGAFPKVNLLRLLSGSGEEGLALARKICSSLIHRRKGYDQGGHARDVVPFIIRTFDGPDIQQDEAAPALIDRIRQGSICYEALTPQTICEAVAHEVLPKSRAINMLRKLNKALGYDDFKALLPDCSLPEDEIDQQALAFALERKGDSRESPRAFIRAKYDGMLRRRLVIAIQNNDSETVQRLRSELRELLGKTEYALASLEDGYLDIAFDILEEDPGLSTEQYARLFELSSVQIQRDEKLPRENKYLALRKINRGQKIDIRHSRFDKILGQAVERIAQCRSHYLQTYSDGSGPSHIDFTDRGYNCVDKIFGVLASIARFSKEHEQGVFEKEATQFLESFRELHPDIFDTSVRGDGVLDTLNLKRIGNHRRIMENGWFHKNPDAAIEIRNKYAGL